MVNTHRPKTKLYSVLFNVNNTTSYFLHSFDKKRVDSIELFFDFQRQQRSTPLSLVSDFFIFHKCLSSQFVFSQLTCNTSLLSQRQQRSTLLSLVSERFSSRTAVEASGCHNRHCYIFIRSSQPSSFSIIVFIVQYVHPHQPTPLYRVFFFTGPPPKSSKYKKFNRGEVRCI